MLAQLLARHFRDRDGVRDPSEFDVQPNKPSWFDGKSLKDIVKKSLTGTKDASDDDALPFVLKMLGFDVSGRLKDNTRMDHLIGGLKELFSFHFGGKDNLKRGNLLGKALFEGDLFGKKAGKEVGLNIEKSRTRQTFNARRLLESIDKTSQGSLNDTSISQYALIETKSGIHKHKQGHSLLIHRNELTQVRATANRFTTGHLGINHNPDPDT